MNDSSQNLLRFLPSVNAVVEHSAVGSLIEERGREMVLGWIREELGEIRQNLLSGEINGNRDALFNELIERLTRRAESSDQIRIGSVINATGVILHTGLGRAPLSQPAKTAVIELAGAGNLEIDLDTNRRRYRGHQLQPAWQALTACEDSLIVNNNAAATLLTLQALGEGREVVISRGQLIEIGGSFRLPEIFALSGAIMREVGTTNRTKLADYERAIGPETAALMHVHPSNYRVIGFSQTPEIAEIAELAHAHGLAAIDDIGSGSLVDVTKYGLPAEPTFIDSINHKADVVLGSGDKLLGGPQAGIILGKQKYVEQIRNHPLARAVRVDKLTLGALSATLDSYLRGEAETEIPTVAMLAASADSLKHRAEQIQNEIGGSEHLQIALREDTAPVGGGSLPGAELPTFVLSLKHSDYSADDLARRLRLGSIRLFCRIHQDEVIIDLRSVLPEDDSKITLALRLVAERAGS
ncbi:MAG: L-seryl-tRNA(Sec) selenium transferase [Planctomycetes bacterium]|nr:L-seryl-tRNA(Sec) selenium transferase [Planctomycetota bacterium]